MMQIPRIRICNIGRYQNAVFTFRIKNIEQNLNVEKERKNLLFKIIKFFFTKVLQPDLDSISNFKLDIGRIQTEVVLI